MKKWEDLTEENKKKYYDKTIDILDRLYYCDRVWEAWQYGTMTQNDFILANEDDDIIENIAEKLYNFFQEIKWKTANKIFKRIKN